MALDIPLGVAFTLLTGVLYLGLAAWVGLTRPRTRAHLAFAVFAAAFAGYTITIYATRLELWPNAIVPLTAASMAGSLLASVAIVVLASTFPEPLRATDRWRVAAAAGVAVAVLAIAIPSSFDAIGAAPAFAALVGGDGATWLQTLAAVAIGGQSATAFGALVLFALRFQATQDARLRGQYALMSAAHASFFVFNAGALLLTPGPFGTAGAFAAGILSVTLVVLWLRNTRNGVASREARNTAWLLSLLLLAGTVVAAREGTFEGAARTGAFGVARTLEIGILAYAILRHQMFGIDLKVKWGIRQSTIGAVFIAVFFVVSELAQNLFSDAIGPYVGVVAAGALVFALAPLQRVAERVANAALPNVPDAPTNLPAGGKRADTYRIGVELALADGVITRAEERALAKLANDCGLDHEEALAIREEVEGRVVPPPARPTGGR